MKRVRAFLLSFLLASVVLAGCLGAGGDQGAAARGACLASANGAMKIAHSWAYDAEALQAGTGELRINVDDRKDSGTATGKATASGTPRPMAWEVAFTKFEATRPFHDGGIERGLVEHGDSGVGDTTIPKVTLECTGWGPVTVRLNGIAVTEDDVGLPLTGHFMVSSTGVRDDATGKIMAADGTTSYSPDRPGDALRARGDYEFWLVARTPAGEAPTIAPLTFADTVSAPNYNRQYDFTLFSTGNIDVRATARNQAAGPLVGQLTVTLRDPAGGTASSATLGGTGQNAAAGLTLDNATSGGYSLAVTGNGVGMSYTLTVTLSYPNGFLLILFWEEGELGD